jgi:dynein heavy chain
MNTVLDDNMTLCLANSERIKLRAQLRMLFEVQDLAVASPATVSRCGMVYLSTGNLNWKEFVTTWFSKNCIDPTNPASTINDGKFKVPMDFQTLYKNLFFSSLDKLLEAKKDMFEPFPTVAIQTAENICNILSSFLKYMKFSNSYDENVKKVTFTYAFSLIWAAGGSIESKHYQDFEAAVRLVLPSLFFPKTETIFDFMVNPDNYHTFISCESRLAEF